MYETPFFLMFGKQPQFPADRVPDIPHVGRTADTEELTHNTWVNFQIAFEVARRNLT